MSLRGGVGTVVGLGLVIALAPPALAGTVARRTPEAGPALAGDRVVWGEVSRAGAVRVLAGAPGAGPRLVHRIPAPTARRTTRGFMQYASSFAASTDAFAALTYTATVTASGSDYVSSAYALAAVGGPLAGPAALLAGSIPPRGDAECRTLYRLPEGVDVDGGRIAVATQAGCREPTDPADLSITVHDPAGDVTVPVAAEGELRHVALAGRYVAWIRDDELGVHDLKSGRAVARVHARSLGALSIDDAALQSDGTVAFTVNGRRDHRGSRLAWTAPGMGGVRIAARHAAGRGIALAGGRVLYERIVSERRFRGELIVRRLGGPARRLATFPERRRRVGDLDLDGTRATWAAQPTRRGYDPPPRGPARIVVRRL